MPAMPLLWPLEIRLVPEFPRDALHLVGEGP